MMKIAQCLMGDRRPVAPYEGDDHVPYPLLAPLDADALAPFVKSGVRVTFTVKIPLAEVARAVDGTLAAFIERTWLSGHMLECPDYRAVGASFEHFERCMAGEVHLQVVCRVTGAAAG